MSLPLLGDGFRLRRVEPEDSEFLLALARHEAVEPFLAAVSPWREDELPAEIERSQGEPGLFGRFVLEVDGGVSWPPAGALAFEVANRRSRIAHLFGVMLHPDFRGRGLDPEVRWTEAEGFPYAGTYTGPDAVLNGVFARLGGEWEGFQAVPSEFVDGGDQVVALGRYAGTYKATGRSFEADFAHVWTLRDSQAVRFRQYVDSALVQEALRG